jgi:hypothetical protein
MNNVKDMGVQLVLDKPRTLRFDFNAMIDIDEKYEGVDKAIAELNADEPGRIVKALKTTRYLVYKGLLHEDPDLTEVGVGRLLTYNMSAPAEINAAIMQAFGIALPDVEKGEEGKNE